MEVTNGRENGHVTEVTVMGGKMVMLQVITLMGGRMVILQRKPV